MSSPQIHDLLGYLSGLKVSEGPLLGQPLTVLPWQREFIENAFSDGVHSAALSVPRAAGKTTVCAGVGAGFLDGPLQMERGSVVLVASSFNQAKISFSHTRHFLGLGTLTPAQRQLWRIADSQNVGVIEHKPTACTLKVIGSDPKRAHGLAPSLILCDEPAQWPEAQAEQMVAALQTSLGKQVDAKILFLGTRPASPDHFFERLLQGGADYAQIHCAGPDDDPLDPATWYKANPSLAYFPALQRLYETEARQAALDPAAMASFKALRLNMGVADTVESILIGVDAWQGIECDILPARQGAYVLGVDLGSTASASGFAAYWFQSCRLEGFMGFGSDPDLQERARRDRAGNSYERMAHEGGIRLFPGCVPDASLMLEQAFNLYGIPCAIVCDRWRLGDLTDALRKIGATRIPIVTRGQGFKDGAEDCRAYRRAIFCKQVFVQKSLTWRTTMAGSRVETDAAGNAKLSKKSQRARDDLACAAILAVGHGTRLAAQPSKPGRVAWA